MLLRIPYLFSLTKEVFSEKYCLEQNKNSLEEKKRGSKKIWEKKVPKSSLKDKVFHRFEEKGKKK